jgi:hypothetical protein
MTKQLELKPEHKLHHQELKNRLIEIRIGRNARLLKGFADKSKNLKASEILAGDLIKNGKYIIKVDSLDSVSEKLIVNGVVAGFTSNDLIDDSFLELKTLELEPEQEVEVLLLRNFAFRE